MKATILSRKAKYTASGASLLAAAGGIYAFSGDVSKIKYSVASNEESIQVINKRDAAQSIMLKKTERRTLKRELRAHPEDLDLITDLEEVEDEITALELIEKCFHENSKSCD